MPASRASRAALPGRQMAAFESQLGILVEKRRLDHQRIGAAHERYQRLCLFGVADHREPGCGRLAGLDLLRRDAPAIGQHDRLAGRQARAQLPGGMPSAARRSGLKWRRGVVSNR